MSIKITKVIGHRGAAAYAPENTLEGLHTAADMGVEWVEFDVKLTRDTVPILFHDDTLDRTTNGSGKVALMEYEDLRQLEAGSWFGDSFAGVKIPTLEEAVDVLLSRGLGVNVEIKPCPGREKETAEVVLDVLSQIWDDHDRILISSFSHVALEVARDMAGDWPRGFLMESTWPDNWADIARYLEASTININGRTINREQVEELVDTLSLPILAYTINDPELARRLQGWGVDSLFSDCPDVILENLLLVH